jgi:AsmA protein
VVSWKEDDMLKAVKVCLVTVGLLVVLFASLIGYVVATFDPNHYKQQVIDAVREKTARTLKLEGDIRLSVFPSLAMAVSKVALSEPRSDKIFFQAEGAKASLKLLPLLSKRVEVDKVEIKGVDLHLVRTKEGRFNFDDMTGEGAVKPESRATIPGQGEKKELQESAESRGERFVLDIAGVEVEEGAIDYADQMTGKRLILSNLKLETGPISENARSHIHTTFVLKVDEPALNLKIDLKSGILTELGKQHVGLTGLDLRLSGRAVEMSDLDAGLKGDMYLQWATPALSISKLTAFAKGRQKDEDIQVKLDIPRLEVARERVDGPRIGVEALIRSAKQNLSAKVNVAGIEGSIESFRTDLLEIAFDLDGEGRSVKSSLTAKLTSRSEAGTYEMPQFTATATVKDPSLPRSPVDARVEGAARLDLSKESAGVDFTARLDESRIKGKVGLSHFGAPSWSFDVNVDTLDVDRYMAKSAETRGSGSGREEKDKTRPASNLPDQDIDLTALNGVRLDGVVQIGNLKVSNVRSSQVRAVIKGIDGRLDVNPLSASLYGGSLAGSFAVQAATVPSFSMRQRMTEVDLGPLLRDAANSERFDGKGNVSVELTTAGATKSALKKGLDGNASLLITDGAVRGIDLTAMIREARNKLRELSGQKTRAENKSEKTDFSELKGTFTIRKGVARNHDLTMKSTILRVVGEGDVDIGNDRIDYLLKPTVVPTTRGQGGHDLSELSGLTVPVRISGPLNALEYTIDYSALALEYGKSLLERAKEDLKGGGGKKIGDAFKGILGR